MAVSGSFDLNKTATQIIDDALEYCGVKNPGQTTPAEQTAICVNTFNFMLKYWQAKKIGVWLVDEVALFLQNDTVSYDIYSSGTHATTSWVKTEIATAGAASDSTIDVDSITGISDGDNIGIELDSGTIQWTTINGSPSGTTITLTASLTSAAAVDNHVYTYTTKAEKPLELIDVQLYQNDGTEYPVNIISRDEYRRLSNKTSEGKVVEIYPDFRIDRLTVKVWPEPSSVKDYLKMSVRRRIDDIDGITDNAAFPAEWLLTLSTNLAYWVAPKFSVNAEKLSIIKSLADQTLPILMMHDQEDNSITIEPRMR